jgi:hypothetical protein
MLRSLFTGPRRVGASLVFRSRIGTSSYAGFTCACGAAMEYPTWRQAVRAARLHRRYHPWPDEPGQVPWTPRRRGRRLAAAAFVLALATVAFAATVASLSGLAAPAPAPAAPTVTTIAAVPAYVPVPAGPPATSRTAGGGR